MFQIDGVKVGDVIFITYLESVLTKYMEGRTLVS